MWIEMICYLICHAIYMHSYEADLYKFALYRNLLNGQCLKFKVFPAKLAHEETLFDLAKIC